MKTSTSTTTRRRSPRFATSAEVRPTNDDGGGGANKENDRDTKQASSWNETNFDPWAESSGKENGGALNKSTRTKKQDKKRPAAVTKKTRRNNDAAAPANAFAVSSRTRSNDGKRGNESVVDTTRTVSFGRETRSANKRSRVAKKKKNAGSLVTPASRASSASTTTNATPTLRATTTSQSMSTVTPHGREASLALAALCIQSDMRNGRQVQPVNQYLGSVPLKKRKVGNAFPEVVHAMVTELNESASDVVQWIQAGEAFVIHKPKSPVLATALQKHFNHGNCKSLLRQLNNYGWKKGFSVGSLVHEHFHRDRTKANLHLIQLTKRPTPPPPPPPPGKLPTSGTAILPALKQASSSTAKGETGKHASVVQAQQKSTTLSPRNESPTETESPEPFQATESRTSPVVETSRSESPKRKNPASSSTPTARESATLFAATQKQPGAKIAPAESGTVEVSKGPTSSAHLAESPIEFDGIQFSSLDPMPLAVQREGKLPTQSSLPNGEARSLSVVPSYISYDRPGKRIRMTLYDGKSVNTSPIDACAAVRSSNSIVVENMAFLGSQHNLLPSPMDRLTAPEDRVPPPSLYPSSASSSSSVGSIPTPLSFKQSNFSDSLLPLVGFADALSSAVGLDQTLFRDL